MTKIKNTKKGMAKKTLSVSLAVAMLATSNVPVWAAEFSDGSEAAFTSEVEAPVVEAEEPVVEEEAAPVVEATVTDSTYGYTAEVELKANGNGWNGSLTADAPVVKDASGNTVAYTWTLRRDGLAVSGQQDKTGSLNYESLGHDDYNHTFDLYIEVTLADGKKVGLVSNSVTVGAVDITKLGTGHYLYFATGATYNGKEQKLIPNTTISDIIPASDTGRINRAFTNTDFVYTYSGDLVNASKDGEYINVTAVVKKAGTNEADPAYTGSLTGKYQIGKYALDLSNDVEVELKSGNTDYEYTGEKINLATDEVKVKIKDSKGLADSVEDISYAIKKAESAGSIGKWDPMYASDVDITMDTNKLENFNVTGSLTAENLIKIVKRDWSNISVSLKRSYSVDEILKGVTLSVNDLTFTDKTTNKEFKFEAASISKIEFDSSVIDTTNPVAKTYSNAVRVTPNGMYFDKATAPLAADLTVTQKGLGNGTFSTVASNVNTLSAEKFAGEGVAVKKDTSKLGRFTIATTNNGSTTGVNLTENVDYVIEYENNTQATSDTSKAKLIVKGIGEYAGSQKVYYFDIERAPLKEVTADKKEVAYNPEYTSAADYLKDLKLTVTADNESTTSNTKDVFTLKDTEYTVKNLEDLKKTPNTLDSQSGAFEFTVEVGAVKDADGNPTGNYKDASQTISVKITVCKKSLSSEDVKVTVSPDSYIYTGTQIVPTSVIVTDGDTILVEGIDYKLDDSIKSTDAVDAGTAKVTVVALAGGRYKTGSTATGTFTITPANIEDVQVTYKDAVYDGTRHMDANDVTLKLGTIDVTKDFDITFPVSSTANINAGKEAGTLTIKAKSAKAKNYSANTKTATFEIKPAELTGTVKVYDEAGREIVTTQKGNYFTYDGTAKTFAKVVFTPDEGKVTNSMKLTENDYEIVYADNVYGNEVNGPKDTYRLAYVFVVAKGNYVGKLTYDSKTQNYKELNDGVYTTSEGEKVSSVAGREFFFINKVEVAAKNVSVSNGVYASGYTVKPEVTIKVDGLTLVEGKDYKLDLSANKDLVNATATKSLKVTVEFINGCQGNDDIFTFNWGIDKFDFANADIIVSGTDADPVVKVMNGTALVDSNDYDMTVADGKVTISAKEDSKNYTGTKTVDIKHELEKPATPMLSNVVVSGNTATAVLSEDVEGATGYDFVIGTSRDCITTKDYVKVNKNVLKTETPFTYVQQGTYYAYCHAWKRDENGQKIFSDWSNAYPFVVTAITPDQPVITSVKASGSTVTVTYTQAANADGYDVVLGTATKKVAGETRPVNYGELVKKNVKGNTVTVTFKNVPAGTYYAGLHAWNRTSEDGKKVFSPWSNTKKVTVK